MTGFILALDASTYSGTVALIADGEYTVRAAREAAMRGRDEERLMPAVVDMLASHAVSPADLVAVACGAGPGSFTSLRIAAAIAKGIAAARRIPLYDAPSPLLVVAGAEPALDRGAYVGVLDAMRGDVFAQRVDVDATGRITPHGPPWLEERTSLDKRVSAQGMRLVGPEEVHRVPPHARGFALLLREGLATPVELNSWEPSYGRKAEAQVRWEQRHGRQLETR